MDLRTLASIIVDKESLASPNSETYLVQVDEEVKKLKRTIETDENDITTVRVIIDDFD